MSIQTRAKPSTGPRRSIGGSVQALVLMLTVMLAVTGIVVDFGHWAHHQSLLQVAAESGALGGAMHVIDEQWRTQSIAFVSANSADPSEVVTIQFTPGAGEVGSRVEVVLRRAMPTRFLRFLGMSSLDVDARAVAEGTCGPAGGGVLQLSGGRSYLVLSAGNLRLELAGPGSELNGRLYAQKDLEVAGTEYSLGGDVHVQGEARVTSRIVQVSGELSVRGAVTGTGVIQVTEGRGLVVPEVIMPSLDTEAFKQRALDAGHYYRFSGGTWIPATPPPGSTYVQGFIQWRQDGVVLSGPYFIDGGSVRFSGRDMGGSADIVATGKLEVIGEGVSFLESSRYHFISLHDSSGPGDPAIRISVKDSDLRGLFFAPNGCLDVRGALVNMKGALYGECFDRIGGQAMVVDHDPAVAEILQFSDTCYLRASLVP